MKYTIFNKDGSIINKEFPIRTICEIHRQMAHNIMELDIEPHKKKELLNQLDEAYDAGKRMGLKLKKYYKVYNKNKKWYEEFYDE